VNPKDGDIDPGRLAERMERLPGLSRLRKAASGVPAYLVGGAVRDLLLGRDRADLDVVVEGDLAPLASALGGELRRHERFATATVREGKQTVDLATARAETYAQPGALPDVRPATLSEDLARRDFTINAMAVPLLEGEPELVDPHGGLEDLQAGVLRVLHPGSFGDDPTRALRAARYAARLGLELEPETATLLREADLGTVSADRVEAELRRIAAEPASARAVALAAEWGLIDPPDGAAALIESLEAVLAEPAWSEFADRAGAVLLALQGVDDGVAALAEASPTGPSEGVRLAGERSPEELAIARALGAEWLDDYVSDWRKVRLEIDGDDLIETGVKEGPAIGRGLQAALDAKLDGEISGHDAELERAVKAGLAAGG
jgi:tRNA nucleotidyltransferase (CCA-adding enzyme)